MNKTIYLTRGSSGGFLRWLTMMVLLVAGSLYTTNVSAQFCFNAADGQWPSTTFVPNNNITTDQVIVTNGFASDFTLITLTAGVTYTFTSSITTDYITIANSAGTVGFAAGIGPVSFTPTLTADYRFYSHADAACTEQASNRSRIVKATLPSCPTPTAHATNLAIGASSAVTVTGTFDAASPAPSGGYLIVRYLLGDPVTNPVDGVTYAANASLGLGTVVSSNNPSTVTITANNLGGNTTYVFYVYPFATGTCSIAYYTTGALSGSVTTPACSPVPVDQPTALSLTVVTPLNITGSFTAAASTPNGYLVVRYPQGATVTNPSDNVIYNTGNTIGLGTVIQANSNLTFSATGLNPSTGYDFYVYSYLSGGACSRVYNNTSPLTLSATTTACSDVPVDQPTSLVLTALSTSSISGSFTAAGSAPSGYLVVRYPSGAAVTQPTTTVTYTAGGALGLGTVVQSSAATTFTQTGLTPSTTYDYYVYAYNTGGPCVRAYNTVAALSGSRTTNTPVAASCPTTFVPANNSIGVLTNQVLSWSGASGDPNPTFTVYFSTNQALVNSMDASVRVLNNSTATTYTPTLVLNTTYYWRVVATNIAGTAVCDVNQFTSQGPLAPSCPVTFTPTSGATNVPFNQVLSWTAAFGNPSVLGYDVYLGTNFTAVSSLNPSTKVSSNQTGLTFTPSPTLIPGAVYYWVVVPFNSVGYSSTCTPASFTVRSPGTVTSTAIGGLYSDAATWVGGVAPSATDNIVIADGATVTMNGNFFVTNVTIGSGTVGAPAAVLQQDATARTFTSIGTFRINSNGRYYPHNTGGTGATTQLGGDFINDGYANFSPLTTVMFVGGSQLGGGSLAQTISGTGTFQGDGTYGIIRQITFATNGASVVNTSQNLNLYNLVHFSGSLNTNGKVRVDNIPQVYGQPFNQGISNIAVNSMGSALSTSPVIFGGTVSPISVNVTAGVAGTRYHSGGNVYLCTSPGTFTSLPTGTSPSTQNVGATVIYLAPLGTLGNPWITSALTLGTQYFYGGNLYTAVATTASATPPTHTSGTAGTSFAYAGTPATVSVNYDGSTQTVRSLSISNYGSGYLSAPSASFSVGAVGATGTLPSVAVVFFQQIVGPATSSVTKSPAATITGGLSIRSDQGVGAVSVTGGGAGYPSAPLVGFPLPTGYFNLVTNQGSGYSTAPTITVTGGTLVPGGTAVTTSNFTVTIASGKVVSVICTGGGTGYLTLPTLAFSGGGGGTGATLAFPTGCLATATATLTNGSITNFTVTNAGAGYPAAPTPTFASPTTATTAAAGLSTRVGLYNLTYSRQLSTTTTETAVGAEIPSNNRINVLTVGTNASATSNGIIRLNGNLELYAGTGALVFPTGTSYGSRLNLNGNTLTCSHPGYAGVGTLTAATNFAFGHAANGSIRLSSPGGNTTRTFPFVVPVAVVPGTGANATTGSTATSITLTERGAASGTVTGGGATIGNLTYQVGLNTGAVYGVNPTVQRTFIGGTTDNFPANLNQEYLVLGQSASLTGPWTVRSAASGTGLLPVPSGNRTTATTLSGPFVHALDVDDYFSWLNISPNPVISSFSPSALCSGGGATVTIIGTNLTNVTSVKFNGLDAASFTANRSTSTISSTSSTASVMTYTTSVAHSFQVGQILTIAAVLPAGYNVTDTVASVTGTTFTFNNTANPGTFVASSGFTSAITSVTAITPGGLTAGSITLVSSGLTATSGSPYTVTNTSEISSVVNPSNGLICTVGGSVNIVLTETGSPAANSFNWTGPNLNTTTGTDVTASPSASASYTVTASYTGGCEVIRTFNVGVVPGAAIAPSASPSSSCFVSGSTVTLNSNLSAGNFAVNKIAFAPATAPSNATVIATRGPGTLPLTNPQFVLGGSWDDGGVAGVPIGFNYNFFGQTFNNIAVGSNGTLMFGPVPGYSSTAGFLGQYTFNTLNGLVFPNPNNPGGVISLFSADMGPGSTSNLPVGTSIRCWNDGTAPTRRFVVEYLNWPNFSTGPNNTVQCIFYETTGIVEIHITNYTTTGTKTIGLQNFDKTIGAVPPGRQSFTGGITTPEAWQFLPPTNYVYDWSGSASANLNSTSSGTPIFTPTAPGTYDFTLKVTNPTTGCEATAPLQVKVNVTPTPPSITGALQVCGSGSTALFSSTPSSGNTIRWYNDLLAGANVNTGTLFITPVITRDTTYYVSQESALCRSTRTPVTVTISTPPAFSTNDPAVCAGTTVANLTSTNTGYDTYIWSPLTGLFQDAALTIPYTGQSLNAVYADLTNPAAIRTYFCVANDFSTLCSARDTADITIQPATASVSANTTQICISGSATLTLTSATAIAAGTIQWQESTDNVSFNDIVGANAATYATGPLSVTKYYRALVKTSDNTVCVTTSSVQINYTNPQVSSTTPGTRCGVGTVNLSASAPSGSIAWYTAASGGSGTPGASFTTPSISTTTTYYVGLTVGGCEGDRTPVVATVTPALALTLSADQSVCNDAVATIAVTSTLGDYDTYIWTPAAGLFTDAAGTIAYVSGDNATTVYARSSTAGATTFTCTSSNSTDPLGCVNVATSIVTVLPATATISATTSQICVSGTTTLSIAPASYAGATIQWQESTDDITFTDISGATASSYTSITLSSDVYYRAQIKIGATNCITTSSIAVTVVDPSITGVTNASRCGTGTVTLSATASAGATVNWFTALTGGTGTTGSSFSPTVSTVGVNNFYASASIGSCFSTPRTLVTATVSAAPAVTLSANQSVCNDAVATLAVTSSLLDYDTYVWTPAAGLFTDAAGTIAYLSGNSATTVYARTTTAGTTTYTCNASNSTDPLLCVNSATTVVRVQPASATITSSPTAICVTGTATLSLDPLTPYTTNSIQWQSSSDDVTYNDISGANSPSYTTGTITAATYFKAIVKDALGGNTCFTTASFLLEVNTPSITGVTNGSRCGTGTVTLSATASAGATVNWFTALTGGSGTTGSSFSPTVSTVGVNNFYASASIGSCFSTPRTLVTATVSAAPAVTLSANQSVCNDAVATLAVTSSLLDYDTYVWTPAAGLFTDAAGTIAYLSGNSATTVYARTTTAGTTTYTCSASNSTDPLLCVNTATTQVSVQVASATVASTPASCVNGTATLSLTPSTGYNAGSIQWQVSTDGISYSDISGANAATYVTGTLSSTTYYQAVIKTDALGATCFTTASVMVTAKPTLTLTANQTVCNGVITALSVLSNVSDYDTYEWSPITNLFTDALATIPYTAGSSATTVYVSRTTAGNITYTATATNTASSCSTTATTVVSVQPQSATITSTPASICLTGNATLNLSPSSGYAPSTIQWQQSSDNVNFTNISGATSASYTAVGVTSTTYYQVVVGPGCFTTSPYTLEFVNPVVTSTTPAERCGSGSVTLQASTASVGATLNWYTAATGGTGTPGTSFVTPTLFATTDYFVSAEIGACKSARVPVTATVQAPPLLSVSSGQIVCNGAIAQYSVTSDVNDYETFVWSPATNLFTDALATIPYVSGTSATVVYAKSSAAGTTTYTVTATNTTTVCAQTTTTTHAVQPASAVVSSTPANLCISGSAVLSLTPATGYAAGTLQWQRATTIGGTYTDVPAAIGTSYTTPVQSTTRFYKALIKDGSGATCFTSSAYTLTINTPSLTTVPSVTRCGQGTVTITATPSSGATIRWFANAITTTVLFTGPTFTSPVINGNTSYYVEALTGTCSSGRTRVDVIVTTPPAITLSPAQVSVCNNDIATISITGTLSNYDTYTWTPITNLFTDALATVPYVSGDNASTVYVKTSVVGTYTYTVAGTNALSGCSNIAVAAVTVNPTSIAVTASPSTLCLTGTSTLTATPIPGFTFANLQWMSSSDNITFTDISGATGNSYTTPTITTESYYRAELRNSLGAVCASADVTVAVNSPAITSTTPGSRCGIGTVLLQGTSNAGSTLSWYAAATGGNSIGTGTSFTTPSISATTSYYVEAVTGFGVLTGLGNTQTPGSTGLSSQRGIVFNATSSFTLVSAQFFTSLTTGTGSVDVVLQNSAGTQLLSTTVPVTITGAGFYTLPMNFIVNPGTGYRLLASFTGISVSGFSTGADYSSAAFNNLGPVGVITSGFDISTPSSTGYWYFHNISVIAGCSTARTEVIATVTPAPVLTVTPSQTVCNNTISQLDVTSTLVDFDTYEWSPVTDLYTDAAATVAYVAGSSATTVYAKSSTAGTTTYTVTATNTSSNCVNQATSVYTVLPASLTITSSPGNICVSGSATVALAPAAGFVYNGSQWFESTDNVTFSPVGPANATSYATAVITSDRYYKTEILNSLGAVCLTPTYQLVVNNPTVSSTTPASRCGVGTVTLGATGSAGTTLNWYTDAIGGTAVGTGPSFVTPTIAATTTYYVDASNGVGVINNLGNTDIPTDNGGFTAQRGLVFNATTDFTLISAQYYSSNLNVTNTVTAVLQDANGVQLQTTTLTIPQGGAAGFYTMNLNWPITTGTGYRLLASFSSTVHRITAGVDYNSAQFNNLAPVGVITAGFDGVASPTTYSYFHNISVVAGCTSAPRVPVVATVTAPPAITATGTAAICAGQSTTISVTSPNDPDYTYVWNTGNISYILGTPTTWYTNDFSSGVGALGTLTGSAALNAGALTLTTNTTSQNGSLTIDNPGITADSLSVAFTLNVPQAGADGVSYSFTGNGNPGVVVGMNSENGTGSDLKVGFVSFSNGGSPNGIYLMYNSSTNEQTPVSSGVVAYSSNVSWRAPLATGPVPVLITVSSAGKATVSLNGTPVAGLTNVQLPAGYLSANKSAWKHYFKARTGGVSEEHTIDDVTIVAATSTGTPAPGSTLNGASHTVTPSATTTYTVIATDNTSGANAGCANTASVTVTVNPLPTTPIITPASDTTCIGTPVTLTVSNPDISAQGDRQIGSGTTAAATSGVSPYDGLWEGAKKQYLFTAAELSAAGLIAGNLNAIKISNTTALSVPLTNYTISIGTTAVTDLGAAYITTGLTPKFTSPAYSAAVGTNVHNFSTPFYWDGTSNVVLDICFDNDVAGTCSGGSGVCYSTGASTTFTTTSFVSVRGNYGDNGSSAVRDMCAGGTGTSVTSSDRPNISFTGETASASPATYVWNPGSISGTSITVSPIANTTYTVVGTNTFGCTSSGSSTITVVSPPQPVLTQPSQVLCPGGDVSIGVTDAGVYSSGYPSGTLVDWYGLGGVLLFSDLSPSTTISSSSSTEIYAVVKLQNACSVSSNTITIQNVQLTVSTTFVPTTCAGNDGSITATVTGDGPFTYVWTDATNTVVQTTNTSSTTDVLSGLPVGTYSLVVTGNVGGVNPAIPTCSTIPVSTTVTGDVPFTVTVTGQSETCPGDLAGQATAQVSPAGSYSYSWNSGAYTTPQITGLAPGVYNVIVTNTVSGCSNAGTYTVVAAPFVTFNTSSTNVTCNGASDGTATVTFGGTATQDAYAWIDGPDFNTANTLVVDGDLTGAGPGTYYVYAVVGGCFQYSAPVVITEPALLSVTSFTPSSGNVGAVVTIDGTGFTAGTTVSFNGTPATVVTFVSATQLTAVVPAGATDGAISVFNTPCSATSTGSFTVTIPTFTTFNVNAFIQGYYLGGSTMNSVLVNQGVSIDPNECDTITVNLYDPMATSNLIESVKAILNIDGTATALFSADVSNPLGPNGNSFYVAIQQRNSLTTYSALPVTFTSTTTYDFTSASSQAFGDNMKDNGDGTWSLFSGDVSQDGFLGFDDVDAVDQDNIAGLFGVWVATDLTGDGFLGFDDVDLADQNNILGVFVQVP